MMQVCIGKLQFFALGALILFACALKVTCNRLLLNI